VGTAMGQAPGGWKEFSLAPAGKLEKPLERTVEWTYAATGSKAVYAACCPWLDVEGSFQRINNDAWSMHVIGVSLKSILSRLENVPQVRIVAPDWMTRERYELTAVASDECRLQLRRREESAPNVRAEVGRLVRAELVERLQLRMHRERREAPVWVVKSMPGTTPKLGNGIPIAVAGDRGGVGLRVWAKDGAFSTSNANDFILVAWLQNVVKAPVIAEGLPSGNYKFELRWRAGDTRSLATMMWEQLGLALVEEKREVEFLVVDYALKPEWSR